MPPSISPIPSCPLKEALVGAFPNNTSPAQSPLCGLASSEVKTIGFSAVPSAIILQLRVIIKPPFFPFSPTIFYPALW
jgi:hypothetical protein